MKKVHISKFIALLLVFACIAIMPLTALAEERLGTVSIVFYHEDTPIENATFKIYKVAELDGSEYVLVGDFANYSISFNDLSDADNLSSLTTTLSAYIMRDSIAPYAKGQTSYSGGLYLKDIEKGLYIGIGEPTKNGDTIYIPQPFLFAMPGSTADGSDLYDVVVEPKYDLYKEGDTVERRVLKIWDDSDNADGSRPASITVQLLKNGEIYEEVVLNEANNWRHEWNELDAEYQWLVIEKAVPDGYTLAANQQGITFTLTNMHEPIDPPKDKDKDKDKDTDDPELPKTGQLWWPVPVLLAAGLVICFAGLFIKRRSDSKNA